MASTQSTLNEYFKSKRVRGALDEKSKAHKEDLTIERSSSPATTGTTVESSIKNDSQQSELPVVTLPLHSEPKVSRNIKIVTRKKKPKTDAKLETIQDAFNRAAKKKQLSQESSTNGESSNAASIKRTRICIEEEEEEEGSDVTKAFEEEDSTSTPTKHDMPGDVVCQQRKRRKAEVTDPVVTPEPNKAVTVPETRGSARKKLILTEESDQAAREKVSGGGTLQLNKCKKLSELRAQLLKVRQCENKLQQFRSSVVEPAQREAELASALIAKASGNLPSPRKTGSPLKMASPRKMFSPHKELSSPYKTAPSPRQKSLNPLLEHFSSLEVEVPVSPIKTPTKSPGKELATAPAYERYRHLVQDTTAPSSELALPYHYRLLREVFRAVDTVVSLMHNRHEVVTFSKLKPAVQHMLRRTFQERNLGQLSRVFPLAYFFRQDKVRPDVNAPCASSNYQLTISANLNYKDGQSEPERAGTSGSLTPCQNLLTRFGSSATLSSDGTQPASETEKKPQEQSFRKMDSLVLVERRAIFHQSLVNIIHQHHQKFLKSLEPSVEVKDVSSIKRWHPHFPLEEVPDIEPAALPQPPTSHLLTNAADVLNAARGILNKNPRLEAAVVRAAQGLPPPHAPAAPAAASEDKPVARPEKPSSAPAIQKENSQTTLSQKKDVALALKGISVSLLEKIRAREAAAASRAMVRSAADTRELEVLSRLPEVARILRHTLVAEKRAALHWDAAIARLRESHSGMLAHGEVEEHLQALLKEMPQWITKHKLSSGLFIKLNKTKDINDVVDELQTILKQRS